MHKPFIHHHMLVSRIMNTGGHICALRLLSESLRVCGHEVKESSVKKILKAGEMNVIT